MHYNERSFPKVTKTVIFFIDFSKIGLFISKTTPMAKAKSSGNTANLATRFANKPKKKRHGIHSKKKASKMKRSKNYKKLYKGQGK